MSTLPQDPSAKPTLIIHGDRDPLVPVAHGTDCARKDYGRCLEDRHPPTLPGMGHDIAPGLMPILSGARTAVAPLGCRASVSTAAVRPGNGRIRMLVRWPSGSMTRGLCGRVEDDAHRALSRACDDELQGQPTRSSVYSVSICRSVMTKLQGTFAQVRGPRRRGISRTCRLDPGTVRKIKMFGDASVASAHIDKAVSEGRCGAGGRGRGSVGRRRP